MVGRPCLKFRASAWANSRLVIGGYSSLIISSVVEEISFVSNHIHSGTPRVEEIRRFTHHIKVKKKGTKRRDIWPTNDFPGSSWHISKVN